MRSTLKHGFCALFAFSLFGAAPASAQDGSITGVVTDSSTNRPVSNAKVEAVAPGGGIAGSTLTNTEGRYRLTVPAGTYVVSVENVGFEVTRSAPVTVTAGGAATANVTLRAAAFQLNPVVVSASKRQEKATDAPARVEVVSEAQIRARPAVTAVDHLRGIPGVDVITQGVQGTNVTTRGFNNIFSGSLHMLTDHRLAGVPSLRVNVPYFVPSTNEDIERIEVVLGPGAALYGPNTASGVLHMLTKSPLSDQGTSISVMGGERDLFMATARTAHLLTDNIGVKLSGQFLRASEWEFLDTDEQRERDKFAGPDSVFFRNDLMNATGISEEAARLRIADIGNRDSDVRRFSGEARVDWQATDELTAVLQAGMSNVGSAVELTGLGAGQVKDWRYSYAQARTTWNRFFAQAYVNVSDAGETYLLRTAQPIVDKSRLYVAQLQHGLDLMNWQSFTYGLDYYHTDPRTEGTINGRYEDEDKTTEVGAYLQSQSAITPKFDLVLAGRVDDHSALPDPIFSPRAAVVFKPAEGQALRATYNRAFSTPSSLNQFLDLPTSMPNQARDPLNAGAARLGYSVRVQGTGTTGFQFRQDGAYRMRSPFNPAGASTLIPAVAAPFYAAAFGAALAGGAGAHPLMTPSRIQFLAGLRPTPENISTNFIRDGQSFALADLTLPDVAPIRETTTTSYEIGYKGVIRQRFSIAADVWKSDIDDFVTPLTVQTPLLALNPQELGQYIGGALIQSGQASPAEAVQLATFLAPLMARVPVGVISSSQISATGAQLLATYTNVNETLSMWGSDVSVQALLTPSWAVTVGGSYVSEDHFDTSVGVVTLNAPKKKGTFAVEYRNDEGGFTGEARARWNEQFPVRSGVYEGTACIDPDNTTAADCVESYTLFDVVLGYSLPQFDGASLQLSVQNLLDEEYRSFPGVPNVGRLALLRLRYEF